MKLIVSTIITCMNRRNYATLKGQYSQTLDIRIASLSVQGAQTTCKMIVSKPTAANN